ncbi:MAG: DUF1206 domain-containing protein [Actinomycetes bacterium]
MSTPLSTGATAHRAANSDVINKAARGGFVAKGLVYALIGALAFQVALGDSQRADQKGALQAVAEKPGGSFVLWLVVVGFAGYAVWRLSEAAWGRREETDEKKRTVKRIGSAANGLVYLAFGVLALTIVTSSSSSSSESSSMTAKVLEWPGGQGIVVFAGLVVIAIAIGLTLRGLRTDFEKHLNTGQMSQSTFQAVRRLGQVGYVARGIVFFLVGIFVITAALDHEPGKAAGFDVALQSVANAPFGKFLLMAAALGLVCFGAYCVAEARYRRL